MFTKSGGGIILDHGRLNASFIRGADDLEKEG